MKTILTSQQHSHHEHGIVSLLAGDCLLQATQLQTKLKTLFGDSIWLQQPPSLHITLMEIICDTDYGDQPREKLFREWYKTYNDIVREEVSKLQPFNLVFEELLVSERAIIIKTKQSDTLNQIRQQLLAKTKLPIGTKNPPTITHSTLARFNEALDLNEAINSIKDLNIHATQHVTEFSLMLNLGPPHFNGEPLERYPFASK